MEVLMRRDYFLPTQYAWYNHFYIWKKKKKEKWEKNAISFNFCKKAVSIVLKCRLELYILIWSFYNVKDIVCYNIEIIVT